MILRLLAVMLLAVPLNAATVNVNPGMTTQQIQQALNGASSGSTVSFAAGNYSITTTLNVPCANLQLSGPVASPPTAVLSSTFTAGTILQYPGNCQALGSVTYLGFLNAGAAYFAIGNNGNFTFSHNTVGNFQTQEALFFDGNMGTTLSNVVAQYNTFGDPSSCAAIVASSTDMGGYCAGIITSQLVVNMIDINHNIFNHVEEGVHFNQLSGWNPGGPGSVCVSCSVTYNWFNNYHRIALEIQTGTPTNSISIAHNAVTDPLNSSYGTFAVSLACCQWSNTMGTAGFSPGYIFNDNVLTSTMPAGAKPPPIGVEFWGTGSQGLSSLVQGNFSNGYTWGYGGGSWAINGNMICGPNYVTQGGYISNQQGQSNPPTQSSNVTNPQCSTTTSKSPTISPNGGTFAGSQIVTLADAGPNTSIWYTTDGSTPVPGTAKLYSAPITISATTTVKAVGMWGNSNQPTSYPAGYGYVPSAVVSATYTASAPPQQQCINLVLNPQTGTYKSTNVACN